MQCAAAFQIQWRSRPGRATFVNIDGQNDTIRFLENPAAYGVTDPVETIETHISRIFLAGDRAYKMKRDVKLPYADFSTPELRLATCRKELELNSRTAPELYLRVRRITRKAGGEFEFDGDGELVDAVVEMKRFDQSALLDRMAQADKLTPALMTETARVILSFHRGAPVAHSGGGRQHTRRARHQQGWLRNQPCLRRLRGRGVRRLLSRCARAPRVLARSPRGGWKSAPLPRRLASAQHLPDRRRPPPVRLYRVQ